MRGETAVEIPIQHDFPFENYFGMIDWLKTRRRSGLERKFAEAINFDKDTRWEYLAGGTKENYNKLSEYINKYGANGASLYFRNEVRKENWVQPETSKTGHRVFRESGYLCPVCGRTVGPSYYFSGCKLHHNFEWIEDIVKNSWLLLFKRIRVNKVAKDIIKWAENNSNKPEDFKIDSNLTRTAYINCLEHIQKHSFWQKAVTFWLMKNLLPLRYKIGDRHPTKGGK